MRSTAEGVGGHLPGKVRRVGRVEKKKGGSGDATGVGYRDGKGTLVSP